MDMYFFIWTFAVIVIVFFSVSFWIYPCYKSMFSSLVYACKLYDVRLQNVLVALQSDMKRSNVMRA